MPFLSNSFYFLRNRGQGYLPKGREDEGTIQSDCSSLPPSRTICVGSSILSLKLPSHSQELLRYILLDYFGSNSLNIKCHEWNYARQKGVTEGENRACQEKTIKKLSYYKAPFSAEMMKYFYIGWISEPSSITLLVYFYSCIGPQESLQYHIENYAIR